MRVPERVADLLDAVDAVVLAPRLGVLVPGPPDGLAVLLEAQRVHAALHPGVYGVQDVPGPAPGQEQPGPVRAQLLVQILETLEEEGEPVVAAQVGAGALAVEDEQRQQMHVILPT